MLNAIKNTWKKSEAAVVVEKLLELRIGFLVREKNPRRLANALVLRAWDRRPYLFGGAFGQRPHKITVAAVALAEAIQGHGGDAISSARIAFIISLNTILSEVEMNGRMYPLSSMDHALLGEARAILADAAKEFEQSCASNAGEGNRPFATFEEWLEQFKKVAGEANSQLNVKDGRSLVDWMDHEPFHRAFRDGVPPHQLARELAGRFDILTFGIKT